MKNPNEPRKPSEARIKANRENARKSTGPRTAEGKDASSRNRLLHGLRASKHILLDENPEEFLILLHDHFDRFQPVGDSEEKLVLRIANDQWRLHRALAFEAAIFRDRFPNVADQDKTRQEQYAREKRYAAEDGKPEPPPPIIPSDGDLPARAFNVDCEGPNSFAKFSRYEGAIERSIDRCLRQLKIYQSARQSNPVDPGQPPAPGTGAGRPVPPAPAGAPSAPMPAEPTDCHSNPTNEETAQSSLARLPLLIYTLLSALPNLLACAMPYAMAYPLLRTGRRQKSNCRTHSQVSSLGIKCRPQFPKIDPEKLVRAERINLERSDPLSVGARRAAATMPRPSRGKQILMHYVPKVDRQALNNAARPLRPRPAVWPGSGWQLDSTFRDSAPHPPGFQPAGDAVSALPVVRHSPGLA
jgi:hypothetical protein